MLLVHISNRYLDLEPVLADLAAATAGSRDLTISARQHDETLNASISVWVAIARNPAALERLKEPSGADAQLGPMQPRPGFAGWSDDHASILPIINFRSMLPHPCSRPSG